MVVPDVESSLFLAEALLITRESDNSKYKIPSIRIVNSSSLFFFIMAPPLSFDIFIQNYITIFIKSQ